MAKFLEQGIVFFMKNNKNDAYKTYEKIADWYDEHRSRALFEKKWLDRATVLLQKNADILDVGCGTGEPIISYFLEKGFKVTGIDASEKMLSLAKARYPQVKFFLSDMRKLDLNKNFDLVIAWHSFFHLPQDDQRFMFKIFAEHLKKEGVLLFTSGPEVGEVWSDNGGENLYHASLAPDEYKTLLQQYGFILIEYKIEDPECEGASVWLARLV